MIALKGVSKAYRRGEQETLALDGIDLDVDDGEFIAIVGPSGSGKSTLMNILGALDVPTGGSYFLDGKDVGAMDGDALADVRKEMIGFVFQSFNLLPRTSALGNVMLPLVYDRRIPPERRRERAELALEAAGLEAGRFDHAPNQLSGGQIQRVAIARALVGDPRIILADEPTGNLDTKTGELVMSTFRRLNEEQGRTIVLITHEQEVAKNAGRIVEIRDGRIISDRRV